MFAVRGFVVADLREGVGDHALRGFRAFGQRGAGDQAADQRGTDTQHLLRGLADCVRTPPGRQQHRGRRAGNPDRHRKQGACAGGQTDIAIDPRVVHGIGGQHRPVAQQGDAAQAASDSQTSASLTTEPAGGGHVDQFLAFPALQAKAVGPAGFAEFGQQLRQQVGRSATTLGEARQGAQGAGRAFGVGRGVGQHGDRLRKPGRE